MLVHFAKAGLLSNDNRGIEALSEFEKAIKYASGENAARYKALAYFNMSVIYNESYTYLEEKECIEEGKKYMLEANDTMTMIHGYLVSGMSHNCGGEHMNAKRELETALALSLNKHDKGMTDEIKKQIAYTNSMMGNYKIASEMYDSLLNNSTCELSEVDVYAYICSLSYSGENSKAIDLFNSLDSNFIASTKPYWTYTKSVVLSNENKYSEAFSLLSTLLDYQNTFVNDKLNSTLVREQKSIAISNEKTQRQLAESRKKYIMMVCCLWILCIVVILMTGYFILRKNKLKALQDKYIQESQLNDMNLKVMALTVKSQEAERANIVISLNLAEVKRMLADINIEREALKEKICQLKHKNDKYIHNNNELSDSLSFVKAEKVMLMNNIEKCNNTIETLKSQLMLNFRELHSDIASFCNNMPDGISSPAAMKLYEAKRHISFSHYRDKNIIVQLETQINEFMNHILSYLRATELFSEEEIKIIIYYFCGFNYKSIAEILNITPNNSGVKRNRLKKKLANAYLDDNMIDILKKYTDILG